LPGYTSECASGQHAGCSNQDCRCACHPWVQALAASKAPKLDYQKTLEISAAAAPLTNTCPKCGTKAKPTDSFCRQDGARMMLGKQCPRCSAPADEVDVFCWQCSWKHGEAVPEPEPVEETGEDPVVRLKKRAIEQGLLKETAV
jgi:uncharacterized Zn finger protein (UPF0148 family)